MLSFFANLVSRSEAGLLQSWILYSAGVWGLKCPTVRINGGAKKKEGVKTRKFYSFLGDGPPPLVLKWGVGGGGGRGAIFQIFEGKKKSAHYIPPPPPP